MEAKDKLSVTTKFEDKADELARTQFTKEKQALIDKACEWLKDNVSRYLASYGPESSDVYIEKASLAKNFRKAMNEMK